MVLVVFVVHRAAAAARRWRTMACRRMEYLPAARAGAVLAGGVFPEHALEPDVGLDTILVTTSKSGK